MHQRLALPFACMLLALTGIPLGVGSRRAGKSSAYVLTVALALLYYTGLINAINFGRQGTIPAGLAVWIPNLVFAVLGFSMLARLEAPGDRDYIGRLTRLFRSASRKPQEHIPRLLDRIQPKVWKGAFPSAASGGGHLPALQLPVLLRAVAGEFCADVPRLHLL